MSPVLILQHLSTDGPAYLGTWLRCRQIAHVVLNTQAGDEFPVSMDGYSALAILGGEMSANDPLPSLRRAEVLIRDAMACERPVIGHCLGGQLMARALGAPVTVSPAPEIGWQPLQVADDDAARDWFGHVGPRQVFQWHEEAFGLPAGAVALASSAACPNQAFAIGGNLAMQFHLELDEEKLCRWAQLDTPTYRAQQHRHDTVQSGDQMCAAMPGHLPAQQALADRIYAHWLASVLVS
jgi:GMP synthase (glutamine-hydrolysing)